ncbi:MAG: hypothetical protein KJ645_13735, partial [Planctomycetes bacterium]|nr:hypothetical protein [Planctomycetota bacterium]
PTGVYRETLENKREELVDTLGMEQLRMRQDFERMYSIRIKSSRNPILHQLGRFGDEDKAYFRPKLIKVTRISGAANEIGSVIRYQLPIDRLSFRLVLDRIVGRRFILYRVMDGFARGGVLVFDLEEVRKRIFLLTIYVAFNFPKSADPLMHIYWRLFGFLFPAFTHDVLWNHSLCKLKDVVEDRGESFSE